MAMIENFISNYLNAIWAILVTGDFSGEYRLIIFLVACWTVGYLGGYLASPFLQLFLPIFIIMFSVVNSVLFRSPLIDIQTVIFLVVSMVLASSVSMTGFFIGMYIRTKKVLKLLRRAFIETNNEVEVVIIKNVSSQELELFSRTMYYKIYNGSISEIYLIRNFLQIQRMANQQKYSLKWPLVPLKGKWPARLFIGGFLYGEKEVRFNFFVKAKKLVIDL